MQRRSPTSSGPGSADSAAEAVAAADVAITMVADEPAVASLYRGDGGVLEGLSAGKVVADMSTVPPSVVLGLADDVARRAPGSSMRRCRAARSSPNRAS